MENILTTMKQVVRKLFLQTPDYEEKNILLIESCLGETRVAHINNGALENFETEMWDMRPEKGNIYKAKIARVESALQAVFVDYGKEKQGFLPFSEIHPDYLEDIPGYKKLSHKAFDSQNSDQTSMKRDGLKSLDLSNLKDKSILVQIVKDIRGNKGAALTSFLALKGRYVILMPNASGTLGVSKKIHQEEDRFSIKEILKSLPLPEGMGLIARSSCLGKKRADIKRDCDYAMRLWGKIQKKDSDEIGLVYEEQGLLIRALRDMYRSEVDAVVINEEQAYKKSREFMKSFMIKSLKKVRFLDTPGLFGAFGVQEKISGIDQNIVSLGSGGSIVIDPTEALVSIDVNSSKSRQHRSVEETAFQTNMEAAKEIARQLRLRDLSGLIVIDFIDMHSSKRPSIEKVLETEFEKDPAVTRTGSISDFGLMEMSRQRLRQSFLERRTKPCQMCSGTGRSILPEVAASQILRTLAESMSQIESVSEVYICGAERFILCILNKHRFFIQDMESRYKAVIQFSIEHNQGETYCRIDFPEHSWSTIVFGQKEGLVVPIDRSMETKSHNAAVKHGDRTQKRRSEKVDANQKDSSDQDRSGNAQKETAPSKKGPAKSRSQKRKKTEHSEKKADLVKENTREENALPSHELVTENPTPIKGSTQENVSGKTQSPQKKNDKSDDRIKNNTQDHSPKKEKNSRSKRGHPKAKDQGSSQAFSIVLPPPKKRNR